MSLGSHDTSLLRIGIEGRPVGSCFVSEPAVKLGLRCYIELDGMLVSPSLLGQSITVKQHPWAYGIELPTEPDSFTFDRMALQGPEDEREYEATRCYIGDPGQGFVEIRIVCVVVNATFEAFDRQSPKYQAWAASRFHDLRRKAIDAVRNLNTSLRLHGQPQIEPSGRFPRILNMMRMVEIEGDEARPFNWMMGSGPQIRLIDDDEILDAEQLESVREDLQQDRSSWVGESLVSEALHLAESEQVSAPAQATLIAAMGVEVHTKDVLRHLVENDGREPVLDLLLNNPRDWSASAHSLFQKALPTVAARDLGPAHKDLSKRVQKLFDARNGVAHKGATLTRDDAKVHVTTARDAVYFLRTLL